MFFYKLDLIHSTKKMCDIVTFKMLESENFDFFSYKIIQTAYSSETNANTWTAFGLYKFLCPVQGPFVLHFCTNQHRWWAPTRLAANITRLL